MRPAALIRGPILKPISPAGERALAVEFGHIEEGFESSIDGLA